MFVLNLLFHTRMPCHTRIFIILACIQHRNLLLPNYFLIMSMHVCRECRYHQTRPPFRVHTGIHNSLCRNQLNTNYRYLFHYLADCVSELGLTPECGRYHACPLPILRESSLCPF